MKSNRKSNLEYLPISDKQIDLVAANISREARNRGIEVFVCIAGATTLYVGALISIFFL